VTILEASLKTLPNCNKYRACILLLCLHTGSIQAQVLADAATRSDELQTDCTDLFPEDSLAAPEPGFFSFLDAPQKSISNNLESMVQTIDAFFANENIYYKSSGSYIRYSLGTLFEEGGHTTTIGKLDLSVRLPRTEKKLALIVESDPAEQQSTLERASNITSTEATNTEGYYAGVQGSYGKEHKWQYKPSVGLKLHFPIQYYVRLRAFRDFPFTKWSLRLTESAYWYDTTGAGFDSEMQWNRLLREDLLFRSDSLVRNTEEYHRFDLSQSFSLIQSLSNRRALTWSLGVLGHSDPRLHATDYLLQLRYRQIIHSDYFFMEVVPQIRFRRDYDFEREDSLLLRFEWLFQKK